MVYGELAETLGVSTPTAFRSVQRLERARLVLPGQRRTATVPLLRLIEHGVPFVFYPVLGPETLGVPTAHSAPPLAEEISAEDALVWPTLEGTVRGQSLEPLYDGAAALPSINPELYHALTLVDAVRVGRARERTRAMELLSGWISERRP